MNYILNFAGYWPISLSAVAAHRGIYCVFAGISPTVARLLYIGESEHVEHRLNHHEARRSWDSIAGGQPIHFTACVYNRSAEREQAEAAMINHLKPPCNIYYINNFPFPITNIAMTGPVSVLNKSFTVYPS